MPSLHLDVQIGDRIEVDDGRVVIHVGQKSGQRTRLTIEAPPEIKIRRVEGTPHTDKVRRLSTVG